MTVPGGKKIAEQVRRLMGVGNVVHEVAAQELEFVEQLGNEARPVPGEPLASLDQSRAIT